MMGDIETDINDLISGFHDFFNETLSSEIIEKGLIGIMKHAQIHLE